MAEESLKQLREFIQRMLNNTTGEELETFADLQKCMDTIEETRQKYKTLVNDYYSKKNPFPPDREDSEDEFVSDIEKYLELVGHCIVVGDADLLYRWGIDFLDGKNRLSKLASSDVGDYEETFEARKLESESLRERFYMDILIDKFKALISKPTSA